MILFLTSSPCPPIPEGEDVILYEENGFVENLRRFYEPGQRLLLIAADPYNHTMNDEMQEVFFHAFALAGMEFSSSALLDSRNARAAKRLVSQADWIILSGGHVPTELAFFRKIRLAKLLQSFGGVVMGISAGSMNSADWVYAQPEEEGETEDPDYERFMPGLRLTELNILPHFQKWRTDWLDGKQLLWEVTLPDSYEHAFVALPDGSYILQEEEERHVFGEAWLITDGRMEPYCFPDESREI